MKLSITHLLAIGAAQAIGASAAVDKSFLGIMVETTSWWKMANVTSSITLMQNIANRTHAPLIIRVGGTSGDQTMYNSSQTEGNFRPINNGSLLDPVILGRSFTDGLARVPNVRYIIQVPLSNSTIANTVNFTRAMLQAIGTNKLEAIEVGNEPNLYGGQKWLPSGQTRRDPKTWTPAAYVAQLKNYTDAIIQGVPGLPAGPIFHVGSLADSSQWSAEDLYNAGLGNVSRIKAFAQHYYQAQISGLPTLRGTYLDHNNSVLHKVNENPQRNLNYFHSANIATPIVISEAGSALGSPSQFERQIDAVLGSALWEVDWALLVMSKNISRVNMNQCNGCNFGSWWTDDFHTYPAAVFAQYYGLMFLSDWLGLPTSLNGDFTVNSLYDAKNSPHISSYTGFIGGKLDRMAILDLTEWNSTSTTPRPQTTYKLPVGTDVKTAELRRLTGNGTDAMNVDGGITYAGTRWSLDAPGGNKIAAETEAVAVKDGIVTFTFQASEAVLVTLHR